MTIKSFFFDSVGGDRAYSAKDFADAFGIITKTGIIVTNDEGELGFAIGGTNYTTISEGKATVEGHFVELTDSETLTVPPGSYTGMVVLRVDITDSRMASLVVRTDQTPIQDASMYELPLYSCTVSNGVITNVADLRVQGGAVAKPSSNVPTFSYKDNGVYLQVGTYSIALTPSQPPAAAKRVWIQIDN